jgi:putative peptidoglycan lipid II flippase
LSAVSEAPPPGGSEGLARSSGIMALGTIVSRALGFVRNLAIAAALGTTVLADTYNVANTIPNAIYILLAGGVLNAVFVPQLVRAAKREDGGQGYTDRLLTLSMLVLLAITVLATLAAPLVVRLYGGGWGGDELSTATAFAYLCLPQIFFYGVFTMLGQVLNARGRFGPMMWTPIVNNLVVIAIALLFVGVVAVDPGDAGSISRNGVLLLGLGTTVGVVAQAAAMLVPLRATGFRYRPRFDFRGHGLGTAGELAKWTLAFVAVNQLSYLVVTKITTYAGTRAGDAGVGDGTGVGFTAYSNAFLILQLPHAIITVSVVTALLPRMSRAAADGRLREIRDDVAGGLRLTAVVLVPAAVALLVLGRALTTVMYARGQVTLEGARYIGDVLTAFAPGLLAYSGHYLTLRAFYAQEDTRTPFLLNVPIAGAICLFAGVAWAVLPLRWITVGVAAGYSLAYFVGWAISLRVLRRRLGGLDGARTVQTYVRLLVAAGISGALAWAVTWVVGSLVASPMLEALVSLLAGGLVLGAAYLALLRAMRVRELQSVLGMVKGRGRG